MTEQEIYNLKIDELSDEEAVETAKKILQYDIISGRNALAKAWAFILLFMILAILIGGLVNSETVVYIVAIPAFLCILIVTEQRQFDTIRWKKKALRRIEDQGANEARWYLKLHRQRIIERYQNFPPETRKRFIVFSEEDEAMVEQQKANRKRHAGKDK